MTAGRRVGLAVLALVVLAAAGMWASRDDRYGAALVRFTGEHARSNRYVNLPDGDAQLSYGSPDGRSLVVQWRDPDGRGWTEPETVFATDELRASDDTVRYSAGTVAVRQVFTTQANREEDGPEFHVMVVCRALSCAASPAYDRIDTGDPQVDRSGTTAYFGTKYGRADRPSAVLWRAETGFSASEWRAPLGLDLARVSTSDALLAPDGSLRVVSADLTRERCSYRLWTAPAGSTELSSAAVVGRRLRGDSECATRLRTFSPGWVEVTPTDPRDPPFWFIRRSEDWVATDEDPSGLVRFDRRRGCCPVYAAGFLHWNDLAYGSPDGRRISVQPHLLGEESWGRQQILGGAPEGYRCSRIDLEEVGSGVALLMRCRPASGEIEGEDSERPSRSYVIAVSNDLVRWDSAFVADVVTSPLVDDECGVSISGTPFTWWTPEAGLRFAARPQPAGCGAR